MPASMAAGRCCVSSGASGLGLRFVEGVRKERAPKTAAQGCLATDNSSAWRMDRQVPLVVPEENADALLDTPRGIIANPNSSTAQLVVALQPLHDLFKIK